MARVRVGVVSDESLFAKTLCRIVAAESSFRLIPVDPASAPGLPRGILNPTFSCSTAVLRTAWISASASAIKAWAQVIVLGVPEDQSSAIEALLSGARGILYKRTQAKRSSRRSAWWLTEASGLRDT